MAVTRTRGVRPGPPLRPSRLVVNKKGAQSRSPAPTVPPHGDGQVETGLLPLVALRGGVAKEEVSYTRLTVVYVGQVDKRAVEVTTTAVLAPAKGVSRHGPQIRVTPVLGVANRLAYGVVASDVRRLPAVGKVTSPAVEPPEETGQDKKGPEVRPVPLRRVVYVTAGLAFTSTGAKPSSDWVRVRFPLKGTGMFF